MDWQAFALSLRLAAVTTAILLAIAIPLAALIVLGRSRWLAAVEALATLPMVLPPTVLGFFLLVLLGPRTAFGRGIAALLGHPLAFSFDGLVVGSVIYSLPFAVQPLVAGFASVDTASGRRRAPSRRRACAPCLEHSASARSPFAPRCGDPQLSPHHRRVRRRPHARRRHSRSYAHAFHRSLRPGGELRLRRRRPHCSILLGLSVVALALIYSKTQKHGVRGVRSDA